MGARLLRSTMALVHCVVPSMACVTSERSTPLSLRTASMAPMMPLYISFDVGFSPQRRC